ncbi:MAG: AAA family ATPase [Phycisphaeraceae bacterium]|nr:AAA family ATPase [Phycisphaeraceae bacterium]
MSTTRPGRFELEELIALAAAAGNLEALNEYADWLGNGVTGQALLDDWKFYEASKNNGQEKQLTPLTFADLAKLYPDLNPPVIDGLLRQGETCNLISAPKIGKSWLAYDLALSIVTGRCWLEAFPCKAGPVLLVDNELHPATVVHRIPKVAEALGLDPFEYQNNLDVLAIRGKGITLDALGAVVSRLGDDFYRAVILDAWYRFIPPGTSENDNAAMMGLYNTLDRYSARMKAAWIVIHHSSKGGQGEKAVTDVGAGAGAQSRAADAHLVLRPHEEDQCVVLEAAVRSFPPVQPIGLRWQFPVWTRAWTLDTGALKGRKTRSEERQDQRDTEGLDAIRKALTDGPLTTRQIRAAAGISKDRAERLLDILTIEGVVRWEPTTIRGGTGRLYHLNQPGTSPGTSPGTHTRPGVP